jgi:hypothetical protein
VAEENSHGLSNVAADAEQQREESERVCLEQFEEFTHLHTRASELCLAIIGSPRVRNHLSEGMRIASLHHAKMAGEHTMLRAAVFSMTELS